MTHTELRFVKRAVNRASVKLAGAPAAVIEQIMIDAIMTAVDYAADEDAGNLGNEVGVVEQGRLPQPPAILPLQAAHRSDRAAAMPDSDPQMQPRVPIIPVDRPPDPAPPPSLLILPGQEGFVSAQLGKKLVGTSEPLKLWREPKKKLSRGAFSTRWQGAVMQLIELVNGHMPPVLHVTPLGTSQKLKISRLNTLPDIVSGSVKVEYGIQGQDRPTRSHANIGGGTLDPMKIDRLVTSTFNIKDETVNWEQRVQDVIAGAEDTFKPRPDVIENRTPAKLGPVDLLMSGDPRRNAGGYGEVGAAGEDPNSIDPRSDAGGVLVMGEQQATSRRRPSGVIVPSL